MAVLTGVPGLEVQVIVNGAPLQEHINPDEETSLNKVVRYIECASGAEFSVRYNFDHAFVQYYGIFVLVRVDGKHSDSHVLERKYKLKGRDFPGVRGYDGLKYSMRKFSFSELKTVDGQTGALDEDLAKSLNSLGTISMNFTWVHVSHERQEVSIRERNATALKEVPEKALKGRAISHESSLKDHEQTERYLYAPVTEIGPPFAEFIFKYRSRDALKALHIVPRSPTPVPLEERDVDTLSFEETRELLRRQRQREQATRRIKQERLITVKREHSGGNEDEDEGVTVVSVKRRRIGPASDADVIDLT